MRYPDWVGLMDVTIGRFHRKTLHCSISFKTTQTLRLAIVTSLCVHVERMGSVHQAVIIG